jgi:PAS domain S-box-containing protein
MNHITNAKNTFITASDNTKVLKETIRKYDTLINNLPGTVYRCKNNRNWDMEYISHGCLDLTGYGSEEFLNGGMNFFAITLEDDRQQVWDRVQKSLDLKQSFNLEYRIKTKYGQLKHVWEQGSGVFDTDGKPMAIEGYIIDITSQKKAERDIIASEAKTKALLQAIPDMMFIQDYDSNYLNFYEPEHIKSVLLPKEIIGKNMKDVLPPKVFKKVRKAQIKTIEDKCLKVVEYNLNVDNETKYFEARIAPLNNHSLLTIVRDITEARAKEALLNIRNNALASASNGIVIADAQQPHLPIVYCNDAFEKITGYRKEEVLTKNCQFLQNDDRDQEEISIMKNAITKGEGCNVVLRNYRKNGQLFWNDLTITPIYNSEKKLTHFIGVQNDVSHKVKEQHLKDQTRKILELIAQDQPIAIISDKIIETAEAHFKDCMVSILVLNQETKTLHKLMSPNVPKDFSQLLEGLRIGPKGGSCGTAAFLKKEIIVPNIATNVLWEDFNQIIEVALKNDIKASWSFPIMSSTNRVLGTFAIYSKHSRKPFPAEKEIILDMTYLTSVIIEKHNTTLMLRENKKELENYTHQLEEKVQERTKEVMATVQKLVESNLNLEDQILVATLAEKKALASETLASAIAHNFPNGFIAVIDKNFRVQFAEGEALLQLGLKQAIFNGMSLDEVVDFSEERKQKMKQDILKTLSGQHLSFEIAYKNRYFSVNTTPLFDGEKNPSGALLVYSDITQQKAEEQNIKNALKKEKELNELKSRFISMASHEFRTPLSAILTSAVLISKQNEQGNELKREKYIAQIEKNVQNLVVILNDFLSLSKLEEGKIKPSSEQIDLIHFSKMLLSDMEFGLKQNQKINFITALDELAIQLDAKLLRRVFMNLLSNASKYSPEDTTIDFKIATTDKTVCVEITDYGMGIPEEEQKRLFQRFFRAKNATNIEGTGLGLNIVKQYVELMHGHIGFKSELHKGSTFYIKFPLN